MVHAYLRSLGSSLGSQLRASWGASSSARLSGSASSAGHAAEPLRHSLQHGLPQHGLPQHGHGSELSPPASPRTVWRARPSSADESDGGAWGALLPTSPLTTPPDSSFTFSFTTSSGPHGTSTLTAGSEAGHEHGQEARWLGADRPSCASNADVFSRSTEPLPLVAEPPRAGSRAVVADRWPLPLRALPVYSSSV